MNQRRIEQRPHHRLGPRTIQSGVEATEIYIYSDRQRRLCAILCSRHRSGTYESEERGEASRKIAPCSRGR
jgi:hypothetical protein